MTIIKKTAKETISQTLFGKVNWKRSEKGTNIGSPVGTTYISLPTMKNISHNILFENGKLVGYQLWKWQFGKEWKG